MSSPLPRCARLQPSPIISVYLIVKCHALQSCRSMREFIASRPVYRHLAQTFLRRCRPLPLSGFVRLSDLSNEGLIAAIHRAARLEHAWITRTPRPVKSLANAPASGRRWYRTLRSPPDEEVDWLSPITSSYILCSTKSGKVYCWDIETDRCLAVWDPHAQWELWKCRVEFDAREVYFTMAMVLDGSCVIHVFVLRFMC